MLREERQLSLMNAFLLSGMRNYRPSAILFAVHFNYQRAAALAESAFAVAT